MQKVISTTERLNKVFVTCFYTILLTLMIWNGHVFAESIIYGYDDANQVRDVSYDNGTEVDYLYDTAGNRIIKAVSSGTNNPPSNPSNTSPPDSSPDMNITVDLDWTASTDPDGDTVSYDIYLGTLSPPTLYKSGHNLNTFTTLPLLPDTTYYWKIVVRDSHNAEAEGSEWSFTTASVPVPPMAHAGGFYYSLEGQQIILDASQSYDMDDGTIDLYEWDVDNDGTFDVSSSNAQEPYTYTSDNTYTIKLRVTDNDGATDEAFTTAIISDSGPLVSFTADPIVGEEPLTVTFTDTSTSHDGIDSMYWAFSSGGPTKAAYPGVPKLHTYTENGAYTAKLWVKDNDFTINTATMIITVTDSDPVADFIVDQTDGVAPLSVSFTNNSTGHDQPLTYEWDFDNDGTVDSTDSSPNHIYTQPGIYTVKLTVTDNDTSTNSLIRNDYISVCYPLVNIEGDLTDYGSIQSTYDAAIDGNTIQSQDQIFIEDFNLNRNITVTMEGGYNCDHSTMTGTTTIEGDMTVSVGFLEGIENVTVAPLSGGAPLLPPGGSGLSIGVSLPEAYMPSHPTSTPPY